MIQDFVPAAKRLTWYAKVWVKKTVLLCLTVSHIYGKPASLLASGLKPFLLGSGTTPSLT